MNATHTEEHDNLFVVEALGVATADEARQLDALITTHGDGYAARSRELSDTAAMLAFSAMPVAPQQETRARLFAAINANQSPTSLDEDAAQDAVEDTSATQAQPSNVYQLPVPKVTSMPGILVMRRSTFTMSAIAASVLMIALAGVAFAMWRRADAAQVQLAQVQNQARINVAREADEAKRIANELMREREATSAFAAPDSRFAKLKGTATAPAARANLIFNPRTNSAMLYSHALPPAPEGKAYQIWYIADGKPLPGGLFTTNNEGDGSLRDVAPSGSDAASAFAVTLEDALGALEPQGTPVLSGVAS
ncbi:MAG: anti-sigma factor [Pyrinomonadaceae bacterium MAG19_C2-C3]|nr:anti-sigma factor [Pyrinomonadaceae bacterium MAG19_C2-C3]